MNFTQQQLDNWVRYERIRAGGNFNMLDPRSQVVSGLTWEEYMFVIKNYTKLREESSKTSS